MLGQKQPIVVDISSSDDEDEAGIGSAKKVSSSAAPPPQSRPKVQQTSKAIPPSVPTGETLEARSFWKAGAYSIGPIAKPPSAEGSLEYARVHPKFLHSNATSHKWAFGAIAELLDNAVDEIHNGATFVKVDKVNIMKDGSPALLFQDDGSGMDPESIRKCMSLGYSSKKSKTTIGQYGNGFKTSTMRLGADVIVFSRANRASKATQSVGLLSYTYLRRTAQDDVIVPMIDFDISGHWAEPIVYGSPDDWSSNLKTILEWSPFVSKEDLLLQFDDIGLHGTKIVIYNLWLNDEGQYELSFDNDNEDIHLRDEANSDGTKLHYKVVQRQSHISYHLRYSLRAYASMLYLRKFKNFKIILRGKPVDQFNIADELKHPKVVIYKPQVATASKEVAVETTIGFIKEAPSLGVCGFNVYHKNRLIRPFWKVIGDGSSRGNGVVGVLEANFIEPAHDKQDFERSSLFVRLESRLKHILMEYWKSHHHLLGNQNGDGLPSNMQGEVCIDDSTVGPSNMRTEIYVEQDLRNEQPGLVDENNQVASEDGLGSMSLDQICEENIQLFMRCDEHRKKESELKKMIEELEKELDETKKKCAGLSSLLKTRKMVKAMKQESGKVA